MRKNTLFWPCFVYTMVLISFLAYSARESSDFSSETVPVIERAVLENKINPSDVAISNGFIMEIENILHRFKGEDIPETRLQNEEDATPFNPWPLVIMGVFILIFLFLLRALLRMRGGAATFGKSKAQHQDPEEINVKFSDVKGCDEAKREVSEYLEHAKNREKFLRFGAKMPSGILLVGPPGCGKTMLAKALACEAGVPFFFISGSDFVEMFVGVGAARVRSLFEEARKAAPSIIFIDEIDAVGRRRGAGIGNQNDEREQTLNQILVELDGISDKGDILVLGATNRPDVLDPALLRPGRFDRRVELPAPDISGRKAILESYVRLKPLAKDVDLEVLARLTYGANGADLKNLANEAAIIAVRRDAESITMADFEIAYDKISMGTERRIAIVDDEKRRTAVHEAGHAIIAEVAEVVPVRKVTIVPRGMALGLTHFLPKEERHDFNETDLLGQIMVCFGGRIAEHAEYGNYSTGASNDLKRATAIARDMVTRFGMSKEVGPVVFLEEQGAMYLGQGLAENATHAEETLRVIDQEIKRILIKCETDATKFLAKYENALKAIADALMDHETINGDLVRELIKKHSS